MENNGSEENKTKAELTDKQRERIERNRQRALLLKKTRLANTKSTNLNSVSQVLLSSANVIPNSSATGGGFIPEDDFDNPPQTIASTSSVVPVLDPAEKPTCLECEKQFEESYLNSHFKYAVCDACRDREKHVLIPKTEALKLYLLKDCDLDKREPPLKYIIKKNPHKKGGDMKLYLQCQVEERALVVWGSEKAVEEADEKREIDRGKRKQKQYDKKIKALRMEVRSSLYRKEQKSHTHVFGNETYIEADDVYQKKCMSCEHVMTYEKM